MRRDEDRVDREDDDGKSGWKGAEHTGAECNCEQRKRGICCRYRMSCHEIRVRCGTMTVGTNIAMASRPSVTLTKEGWVKVTTL